MDERYQSAQITEELPYGSYYEAEDSFIQRKVQIFRFTKPESVDVAEWKETFGSNAADIGTITHPGLPIIYENGVDEEGPFAIRQLLDSTSLNAALVEKGPLTEYEGWELAQQLLEIHDAARTSNNFHGALDANYIGYITRPSGEKRYSITNYGLAEIHNRVHKSNEYFGACYLLSPEQAKGEPVTEQSQIYAIGQLIFHALCGGHPWIETPVEEIPNQEPLASISLYNEAVPEATSEWLSKLIAVDPADRFSTYAEAFEALPNPIQSAPVPINATGAVYQTPVTQPVGIQPTSSGLAADILAVQQTTNIATLQKSSSKKLPLIIGGAVLLLIIIIFALSGGDDSTETSNSSNAGGNERTTSGLLGSFDFDSESLTSKESDNLQLEPLRKSALFARKGLKNKGKSLQLDRNHYYRIPISDTAIADEQSDYTVSFWVMPTDSSDTSVAIQSAQPWDNAEAFNSVGGKHVWNTQQPPVYGNSWNMITMVCARSAGTVTIYIDGEFVGSSVTDELNEPISDSYIYIGCDSQRKSTQKTPVLMDNLQVWDRRLKPMEIKELWDK